MRSILPAIWSTRRQFQHDRGSVAFSPCSARPDGGAATSWDSHADDEVDVLAASGGAVSLVAAFRVRVDRPATGWPPWIPRAGRQRGTPASMDQRRCPACLGQHPLRRRGVDSVASQSRGNIAALNKTTGQPSNWSPRANGSVSALALDGVSCTSVEAFPPWVTRAGNPLRR